MSEMVGQEIIQEMIRAQIVAFLKSREGNDWIGRQFEKEFNVLFQPSSSYNREFEKKFMSHLQEKIQEILGQNYVHNLAEWLVTIGMKYKLEELGYTVTAPEPKKDPE